MKTRCLLGYIAVVSNFYVTQNVGQLLQDKHFYLIHRAAEFQVAQIEAGIQALLAPFVIRECILLGKSKRGKFVYKVSLDLLSEKSRFRKQWVILQKWCQTVACKAT